MTARVKISQNVDIHAKIYLVHLKVEHCQTLGGLHVVKYIYSFFGIDGPIGKIWHAWDITVYRQTL